MGGQYGQVVGVILLFSWSRCLSGWDCHGCQSCVLLRVGRLVTGQCILGGKVVGLDCQCGQAGRVVGMLESSSQDDISNSG